MSAKRKCNAIVTFKHNEAKSRYLMLQLDIVTTNSHNITLYSNDGIDGLVFESLQEMYNYVLQIIHSNNFYCNNYISFNSKWYDISWINIDDGKIHRYGLTMHWDD